MVQVLKKMSKILNGQQKIRVVILVIMMIIGAALETLGVGLILPLVTAIITPDLIESNELAKSVCEILKLETSREFVIAVLCSLIGIYILKNVYLFFEYYVQNRFICKNRFSTQYALMKTYLERPYEYFLNESSGQVIRVVTSDVSGAFSLLNNMLALFTEAFIGVALIITIIITDPTMAVLASMIFGIILLVIGKIIKPILRAAGASNQQNSTKMNTWLLQSISGIKEVKVGKKEDYFLSQFSEYGKKAINSEQMYSILSTMPRFLIEAFGVGAMLGSIVLLVLGGRELSTLLPQLSAFAMAAVRLFPSVNRISGSLNAISYYEPMLDKLLEHLSNDISKEKQNTEITKKEVKIELNKKIELSNVTYRYPNTDVAVLKQADMEIPVGKSVGVVGASGAGKTTAIDIILGLLAPEKGAVLSDGVDIRNNYISWLSHIGYIPQMIFMLDDTIKANVAFGIGQEEIDERQVWKALEEAQLVDFVKSLPDGIETTIGERGIRLSGGQRQRIGIARALYTDPELLIFDEATSALDNETEAAIMESINSLHGKKTMIIIAHRLGTIKDCDIVYRIEKGTIKKEQ